MFVKPVLRLSIVMLLLASIVGCGSSAQLEATIEAQETLIAAGSAQSTPDMLPPPSAPANTPGSTQPSSSPTAPEPTDDEPSPPVTAPSPSGEPLDVDFTTVAAGEITVDPGWTRYVVALAIHNNEARSIYLAYGGELASRSQSDSYIPTLPRLDVLSDSSYVETETGETYPAILQAGSSSIIPIIPGGMVALQTVSSRVWRGSVFDVFVQYDVPSLLDPARLVIAPGLSSAGSEPLPLSLDLTQTVPESPMFEPTIPIDPLPEDLELNEYLVLHTEPHVTEDELFSFGLSVQNLDITDNQSVNLYFSLTDPGGSVRMPEGRDPGLLTVGPGITAEIPSDFSFDSAPLPAGTDYLFLTLITDQLDKTYSFSLSSPNQDPNQKTERVEQAFSVSDFTTLVIDNFAGEISVKAGQHGEVLLVATKRALSLASLDAIDIEINQQSDQLVIGTRCEECRNVSVSLDLIIPPELTLSIRTGAGNVSADGATGEIELHTGAGNVEVAGAGGPVTLETGAGKISYEGTPRGTCVFETGAGDIILTVPLNIQATLDLSTSRGTVEASGFAVDGEITANTIRGSIGDGNDASIYANLGVGNISLTPR